MMRDIVKIDADRCTGCGMCAEACAEGAIKMIGGKAVLVSEAHCDGLGACLPACPADAISIEKREAADFVEKEETQIPVSIPMACPGSAMRTVVHKECDEPAGSVPSRLSQWPVQLRLVPAAAPFLENCDLLVAADCTAFANGDFHDKFIKGRKVVIGCPKLDPAESMEKIRDIFEFHKIKSVTVVRMDVPCCSPIANITAEAAKAHGVPCRVFTVYADGKVTE